MIMFFLPWWVYVLVGTIAFTCALAGQWLANMAQLGVDQPDDGPFPCFEHLGTDDDGAEDWCGRLAGHEGEHLGMNRECARPTVYERLFESEGFERVDVTTASDGDELLLPGPGEWQTSKAPRQENRPWPGCMQQSGDGRCRLVTSHIGPHEYI